VSPVRYEQGFYIPEDGTLRIHRREKLESYILSSHLMPKASEVSTVE
jgi:hypothetical protein